MGTKVNFGGKQVALPNSYARVLSGIKYPEIVSLSGEALLIDLGGNAGWGMGAGIDGELSKGLDSFYSFTTPQQAKNVISGGRYYRDIDFIFKPSAELDGVPTLSVVKCATTTSSLLTIPFENGLSFKAKTKIEGVWANGNTVGEERAEWVFEVESSGAVGDIHEISINSLSWEVANISNVPINEIAGLLAHSINIDTPTHGYSAKTISNKVVVTAPLNTGALANTYSYNYIATGTASGTSYLKKSGVSGLYLSKGFAVKTKVVSHGVYKTQFYKSTYAGYDNSNNTEYEYSVENSVPLLIAESKNYTSLQGLISWAKKNTNFQQYFELVDDTEGVDGVFGFGTIPNGGFLVSEGGTENYDLSLLDSILENINRTDCEFILTTEGFSNALSPSNIKINNWVRNESRYLRQHIVAGGTFLGEWDTTKEISQDYDNDVTQVVFGGFSIKKNTYDSQSMAFIYTGRMGGILPENPTTRKTIGVDKLVSNLTDKQLEEALEFGVIVMEYNLDAKAIVVLQGVNTLQDNDVLANEDGSTFSVQLKRLDAYVNKYLMVSANKKLLLNEQGANKRNLNVAVLKKFAENELADLVLDNKILSYRNVLASIDQDNAFITYEFEANTEITKIFITGTRLIF
jgi:hypothetical protein